MKLTRQNLNKYVKWTSSKFNSYKKNEVIDKVLKLRPNETFEISCGSYAEGAYNGGYKYYFHRVTNKLVVMRNNNMEIFSI